MRLISLTITETAVLSFPHSSTQYKYLLTYIYFTSLFDVFDVFSVHETYCLSLCITRYILTVIHEQATTEQPLISWKFAQCRLKQITKTMMTNQKQDKTTIATNQNWDKTEAWHEDHNVESKSKPWEIVIFVKFRLVVPCFWFTDIVLVSCFWLVIVVFFSSCWFEFVSFLWIVVVVLILNRRRLCASDSSLWYSYLASSSSSSY